MLVVIALAAGAFWLSISRPAGSSDARPTTSANDPSRVPQGQLNPPADLGPEQVWLGNVALSSATLVAAGTPLLDVRGSGREVVSGEGGITAGWVRLTGTVPFEVVAAEMGPGTTVSRGERSAARVTRTVVLLGRELDVVATGTVDVVDGRLVVAPTRISIEGAGFLDDVLTALAKRFVTIEHEIDGLPDGLVLQHVAIVREGFRATLEGSDVLLTASSLP